tara:strand:+ start:212 stop:514 length:303 start_codon:yes stop_codon:yes gene_type:complete
VWKASKLSGGTILNTRIKMRNLTQLQYTTDMDLILNLIKDNDKYKDLETPLINIFFYVNQLELERRSFDNVIDKLRGDKLRAIKRARRVEEQLYEKKKIK